MPIPINAYKLGSNIIHVRESIINDKPSVILIPGLGLSGDSYMKYAELLAPIYSVYIVDLPGFGKTPKPPKTLTIKELAQIIVRFVTTQNIVKPVLVGQSFGCQVAVEAVTQSPSMFSKLVLLAPTTNRSERTLIKQGFRLLQDALQESPKANSIVFINYLQAGIIRYFISSKYMIDHHIEDSLKRIRLPVLIIRGTNDPIVPKKWTKYLAGITTQGTEAEIFNASHLIHYDKPKELFDSTKNFIN